MSKLHDILLRAPESELNKKARNSVLAWSKPPKAIEVLHTLNQCVQGRLASGLAVKVLQVLLDDQMLAEKVTRDELLEQNVWRKAKRS